ncbi:MAG: hypothetical protein U0228_17960 [Myxococcaceae bacterium]
MIAALALILAASFPLPTVDGKAPAVTRDQKVFRLPIGFERVKTFYGEQFGKNDAVKFKESVVDGKKTLTLTTAAKSETWTKAVIKQGEVETVIEVTAVMQLDAETINGNGKPLVEFVFGRSPDVDKAVKSIDHTDGMRAK